MRCRSAWRFIRRARRAKEVSMQVLPLVGFWLKHGGELTSLKPSPRSEQLLLEVFRALTPVAKQEWPQRAELLDDLLSALTEAFAPSE
jgi:hypothetical protein